jgi:DNA-binding NarL/FixJ family response regulator
MLRTIAQNAIRSELMSIRILVVDDQPMIRRDLRLLLEAHADWQVCGEAVDGIDAIEKHRLLKPRLVVMDVSMPAMNGLDASLDILKETPSILILLCTSYLTRELIEEAHNAGIRGTLSKDTMQLVPVAIEALLRGEEFGCPAN